MSKTVKEIIIEYLKQNGHDGLAGDSCGCTIDDLAPCGEDFTDCIPAKKIDCKREDCETTECDWCDGFDEREPKYRYRMEATGR